MEKKKKSPSVFSFKGFFLSENNKRSTKFQKINLSAFMGFRRGNISQVLLI